MALAASAAVSASFSACTATGKPERRRTLHPVEQGGVVGRREIVDAGARHECLETDDASCRQLFHALQIDGRQPAPESEVDTGAGLGRFPLGVEGGTVEGRRMGVEGHLGHGRRAADRAGGRAGCPAFPIGPPRLVEVNMDVDDARKDVQPAGIDLLARRARDLGGNLDDRLRR